MSSVVETYLKVLAYNWAHGIEFQNGAKKISAEELLEKGPKVYAKALYNILHMETIQYLNDSRENLDGKTLIDVFSKIPFVIIGKGGSFLGIDAGETPVPCSIAHADYENLEMDFLLKIVQEFINITKELAQSLPYPEATGAYFDGSINQESWSILSENPFSYCKISMVEASIYEFGHIDKFPYDEVQEIKDLIDGLVYLNKNSNKIDSTDQLKTFWNEYVNNYLDTDLD